MTYEIQKPTDGDGDGLCRARRFENIDGQGGFAGDLVSGLHYLYERRMCHRALNPENILVLRNRSFTNSKRYDSVVTDFGVSMLLQTTENQNSTQ